jgi:cell division septation protein DedD
MKAPDQISVSSQAILWVAGMSVGFLTLAFVLGVQVGKQSAALRHPATAGMSQDLKELPEPLADQLKAMEPEPTPKPAAESKPAEPTPTPKEEAKEEPKAEAPAGPRWTLQLVATPDAAEAKRVMAKAKAAGFATIVVKDKKFHKVRLAEPGPKAEIEAAGEKLKKAGLKIALMKVG